MVDTAKLLELLPHYVAMLLLVFLAVVFAYPFVVRRLGYAPPVLAARALITRACTRGPATGRRRG